jgi:hypothetical protein
MTTVELQTLKDKHCALLDATSVKTLSDSYAIMKSVQQPTPHTNR